MDTWSFGPFVVPQQWLMSLIAVAVALCTLHFRMRGRPERSELSSVTMNAILIWLLVWKLSVILFAWSSVVERPADVLYFNGGERGLWLAIVTAVVYIVITLERRRISRPYYTDSMLVSGLGGYAVYVMITFFVADGGRLESLMLACFGVAAVLLWLRSKRPDTVQVVMQRLLVVLIGGAVVITLMNGVLARYGEGAGGQNGTAEADTGLAVGQLAPDFELTLLTGEKVKLSDYRGKVVFVNFWATWCPPCRTEMPYMEQFFTNNVEKDVVIVGVNATHTEASLPVVQAWIEEWGVTFPIPLDSTGEVGKQYRVQAYPATFVLDEEGRIREKHQGPMNELMLKEAYTKAKMNNIKNK
ncbi:redoxin domain-containing protein [Paenibacillus sp. YYML68]|uniref:redoxin domain-containing protein n=1 Tax=Paenibacillus sp. YYML68 TaxID=2909250 RepID=UPI0024915CF8|nr:redoxin domain-containing protein [Paenibacillus sp. YYML68]